jgi:hypothetical protein
MPLTFEDRKKRIPIGAQRRVADGQGVKESYVSAAMRDEVHPKTANSRAKLRRVQEALALELGLTVDEVFGEDIEPADAPKAMAS